MALRIGIRTMRVATYSLSEFGITTEEAEKFAMPYTAFDVFNVQTISVAEPRVEKRSRYFHISFIPVFPVGVDWTIRKTDGKLYIANLPCENKIRGVIPRSRSPWYSYLALWILLVVGIGLIFFEIVLPDINRALHQKKAINERYTANLEALEHLRDSSVIVLVRPSDYLSGYSWVKARYAMISEQNNQQRILYLPDEVEVPYGATHYQVQTIFRDNRNGLIADKFTLDELKEQSQMSRDRLSVHSGWVIREVRNDGHIHKPLFEIINAYSGSFEIFNQGIPVTIIDVEDMESDVVNWRFQTPQAFDDDSKIKVRFTVLDRERFQSMKSKWTLADHTGRMYEYWIYKCPDDYKLRAAIQLTDTNQCQ